MIYLLDTNTCIRFLNGTSILVRHRIDEVKPRDLVLCSVVKAELVFGALKSALPEQNLRRLHSFFARFVSLPFDDAAAVVYGEIRRDLEQEGTPIGPNDVLIAAIARTNDLTLVSHNTREFQRVDGLQLEDWEKE